MELKQNLSAKLKTLRALRSASLEEYAEEIGIGKTTLQDIEGCKSNFTADTVSVIAQNLGVPPSALLSEDYSPEELHTAMLLLRELKCFTRLTVEQQHEAAELFDRLVRLLGTVIGG